MCVAKKVNLKQIVLHIISIVLISAACRSHRKMGNKKVLFFHGKLGSLVEAEKYFPGNRLR